MMKSRSLRPGRADVLDRLVPASRASRHGSGTRVVDAHDATAAAADFVRAVVDQAPMMVFAVAPDGVITFAEGGLMAAMGLQHGEVVGLHLQTVYPDAPSLSERFARALAGEESRTTARHGEWNLEVWYRPQRDERGAIVGVLGIASEIDATQRAAALRGHQVATLLRVLHGASLRESLRALAVFVEASADGLRCDVRVPDPLPADVDAQWTHPIVTDRGDTAGCIVGRPDTPRAPSADESSLLALAARLAGIAVDRGGDRERGQQGVARDPLTGLVSRTGLLRTLEGMISAGAPPALLFCDVDRFKLINDSLGPEIGDRVLSAVAARLRSTVREIDVVARVGGDEFVVLLPGVTDRPEVERAAHRVLARVAAPMAIADRHLLTTMSIGVALPHPDDRTADLLSRGDIAMSRAKEQGRERHVVLSRTPERSGALRRLEIQTGIRLALERDELRLHFQPIVRCDDGSTVSFEALVRWEHPEHGLVDPDTFVPVARDAGLLDAIDGWVLREACCQVGARVQPGGMPSRPAVSVNFAGLPFDASQLEQRVLAHLDAAGLSPQQLIIEVTEEMLAVDRGAVDALERLRGHGVRIAIDDFGTGYSSLHRLKSLPIDVLKVDRSFVEGLGDDATASALLDAIVTMGHALGMEIVAEGVETAEQLAEVKRLGCDMAQGHHFAPPAPLAAW